MDDRTTFDSLIANVARVPSGDEHVAHAMIGQTFGSYRIVAPLGAGGMGWVFLAEHTVLGSRAAVKVLKPSHSQQQHLVQRFFDEARAATRVADPGIVTVLDFGWHASGAAYLAMEHLTGQTLAQRVHGGGRLLPAQALAVVRQCAIAMAAAHARGIVHRDLKPDNIFIVPDPAVASERIKVLDFGIAKLLDEGDASHGGTSTGLILGTPGYMSPEQCRGAGHVDHRTDIYALGCVLFFMLCGRPPFLASTPGDLIAAHLTAPPPAPSSLVPTIAPSVDAVVARCLAKSADERYQTMQDLTAAIDQIAAPTGAGLATALAIGTQPAQPSPMTHAIAVAVTTAADATPLPPRSRVPAIIAVVLATAVAAVTVVLLATNRGDAPPAATPPPTVPLAAPSPPDATVAIDAPATEVVVPVKKLDDKKPEDKRPARGTGNKDKGTRPARVEPTVKVDAGSGSAAPTGSEATVKAGSAAPAGGTAPGPGSAAGSDDPFDHR